jgi:hypothetical protein
MGEFQGPADNKGLCRRKRSGLFSYRSVAIQVQCAMKDYVMFREGEMSGKGMLGNGSYAMK